MHFIYRESHSHYSCRSQTQSFADKTEYIKQISDLLASKDFRERIKGIDQLVADCQNNPNMVINSIFPVSVFIFLSPNPFSMSLCTLWSFHYNDKVFILHFLISLILGVWCLQSQAAGVQQQGQLVCPGVFTENHPLVKGQAVPSGQHPGPSNCGQSPQLKEQCHLLCCYWSY